MTKPFVSIQTKLTELDCSAAFNALQANQALYAYYFSKACWSGAPICFFERSFQSPALIYLILKGFETGAKATVDSLKQEFDQQTLNQILIYIASVIDNSGNYTSFGDSKFVPECTPQLFQKFLLLTPYWSLHKQQFQKIYDIIKTQLFHYESPYGLIDFVDKNGTTGYYSKNITFADAEKIKEILINKGLKSQNNRLTKQDETHYTVKIASIEKREETFEANGITVKLQYGQFEPFLSRLNNYLKEAQKYSANEHQSNMLTEYIQHFSNGDMNNHIESQKHWIQDKGPIIETNIGFIETYLDPLKLRAEYEGFVAVVNKEQSSLLNKLVDNAQTILKYLPWGDQFEVEVFKKPDFTSLDVLSFASSGIPVGINIPNYDQVRQHFGFKNVNLGNAYGKPTKQSIQYTPQEELQTHLKYYNPSLFVIVALHELLGHGSGKLFHEKPVFLSPLDGKQINTFYKQNETWGSVFGKIASTYQECKADSVALYLSVFEDVQQILLPKYTKEERWQIVYVAWFDLIMGGIKGLYYFDVQNNKWLQAHIGASFAIFSVLKEEGGIFQVKQIQKDGLPNLQIHLNKQAIATKGKDAIGKFLKHLQIYKSTADVERGKSYFQKYLQVDQQLLKFRQIVVKNRKPRRLTVQPEVKLVQGKVQYVRYENTVYGQIDSALAHYHQNVEDIIECWWKSNQEFSY